jgi:hypothetical protein
MGNFIRLGPTGNKAGSRWVELGFETWRQSVHYWMNWSITLSVATWRVLIDIKLINCFLNHLKLKKSKSPRI